MPGNYTLSCAGRLYGVAHTCSCRVQVQQHLQRKEGQEEGRGSGAVCVSGYALLRLGSSCSCSAVRHAVGNPWQVELGFCVRGTEWE